MTEEALARALLGEVPFTGKLPISVPPHYTLGGGLSTGATN